MLLKKQHSKESLFLLLMEQDNEESLLLLLKKQSTYILQHRMWTAWRTFRNNDSLTGTSRQADFTIFEQIMQYYARCIAYLDNIQGNRLQHNICM